MKQTITNKEEAVFMLKSLAKESPLSRFVFLLPKYSP